MTSRLLLIAYTCSGLAGLIYEVTWTRLLTLYIGHTTAAASAVVAAFLGGLAIGAAVGGRIASKQSPRRCLQAYVGLEFAVAAFALLVPLELRWFSPVLQWAYQDGAGGALFPTVRVISCIVMVMLPALALGATFPMAIRWLARGSTEPARQSSTLYFVNTIGAAAGSVLAGFVLIPSIGMSGTIYVAMAATTIAALSVLTVLLIEPFDSRPGPERPGPLARGAPRPKNGTERSAEAPWLAMLVLGVSGFAALVHEIAWTRILSLILGPTTYAFAATLAAVIGGVAIGSGVGAWLVSIRASKAAGMLALTLSLAAVTASWTYAAAGARIPMMVARQVAESADFDSLLLRGVLLTMALILPTSACLGAAFPLALALTDDRIHSAPGRFGIVYAINTVGSVLGSLAAGFVFIPAFGIQPTLWIVSGCLIVCVLVLMAFGALTGTSRIAGLATAAIAVLLVVTSPPWDRELLASGVYMYAPYVPKDLDLETQLKAGELLYYEEGAAATVSVKRLTGTTTLAVDGKTDASNRGDMLTQKLIAHLPLLLHPNPKDVFILGLGSGMTLGAALTHPINRADVAEISPEVVKASAYFKAENRNALADPRSHLILGDGRSHLALTDRKYDVIISEPSNPWIAGVSSLFTKEFFESARHRLAAGGVICQWANAYNISQQDLKSIIATFTSVFPQGTVWLVGRDDVLLVGTLDPIEAPFKDVEARMKRPDVANDLATVGVRDAFSILSLQIPADPKRLAEFTAGSRIFTDDRLPLEFTAPRELHSPRAGENGTVLRKLVVVKIEEYPEMAVERRNRARMLAQADHHDLAIEDFLAAIAVNPNDAIALDGLAKSALINKTAADVLNRLRADPPNAGAARWVARSKLLAADGRRDDALAAAGKAAAMSPSGFEQLASLHADAGDTVRLDAAVAELRRTQPETAHTEYFAAVAAFLHGDANAAVTSAQRAIAIDANYAPTYDLIGAAYTKLNQLDAAREAFKKSLSFDAHDSTAYENLGVLELNAGNRALAARYFAEALWLVPDSRTARQGLTVARTGSP
ncbi:MAG: fused MFS/spermidine synthase [Vicinamibacterales bacterium]